MDVAWSFGDSARLAFDAGGERWLVEAAQVVEVLPACRPRRLPFSHPWVLGVRLQRGRVTPVYALERLIGQPDQGTHHLVLSYGDFLGALCVGGVELLEPGARLEPGPARQAPALAAGLRDLDAGHRLLGTQSYRMLDVPRLATRLMQSGLSASPEAESAHT